MQKLVGAFPNKDIIIFGQLEIFDFFGGPIELVYGHPAGGIGPRQFDIKLIGVAGKIPGQENQVGDGHVIKERIFSRILYFPFDINVLMRIDFVPAIDMQGVVIPKLKILGSIEDFIQIDRDYFAGQIGVFPIQVGPVKVHIARVQFPQSNQVGNGHGIGPFVSSRLLYHARYGHSVFESFIDRKDINAVAALQRIIDNLSNLRLQVDIQDYPFIQWRYSRNGDLSDKSPRRRSPGHFHQVGGFFTIFYLINGRPIDFPVDGDPGRGDRHENGIA